MTDQFATILEHAQGLSRLERAHYLGQACKGDLILRQQIEERIAAREKADRFFGEVPASPEAPTVTAASVEEPGQHIGRYKLREKIGEGGCGAVYVADQEEPVRRRVALKVIKLGMDTRNVIARFEAERQALAMMDHPNIAKVLDAGATETGRPYFVMELVRGIKITDYCDQNNLTTRERLDLFIKVCQAVQHAHQKGIIHRDLKPSNILVTMHDGVPVPKVIDFGISKATEGRLTDLTIYTELHQFIGTPAYMSPEQAEMSGLDIDTRGDIYSLGVLLYELLTGKTPFDPKELLEAGLDEMRRTIREKEPARPSTRLSTMLAADLTTAAKRRQIEAPRLVNLLRGDLDWIVMKALEKDRTRRYETANGFAADVQRYLRNELVTARPPSAVYRFQKAFRRNRLAYAAATAVSFALLAGAVLSSMQAVRARRAETLAKARLREAEQARQDAEEVSKFLQQVFQSPNPEREGRTITVAETLDRAVKQLQIDLKDQPDRQARLQSTLAATYSALGLFKSAIPLQEQVLGYWQRKAAAGSSDRIDVMQDLGDSYQEVGRSEEALKLREEVLPLSREFNGPEHPKTLRALYALAISYSTDPKRREEVLKMREQVLSARRHVLGPEHPDTIRSMIGVGVSLRDAGRPNEAIRLEEETLALSRRALGPAHPRTLQVLNNLSFSYQETGHWSDATRVQEELLESSRKINGPEHPRTLMFMNNLGLSYSRIGRFPEALAFREQILEISQKNNGPDVPETLGYKANLALSYYQLRRTNEAINLQMELVQANQRAFGPDNMKTLYATRQLAEYYLDSGRKEDGLKLFREVVSQTKRLKGPNDSDALSMLAGLGAAYDLLGQTNEALQAREEWTTGMRKLFGSEHPETLQALGKLAGSYSRAARWEDALKIFQQILSVSRKVNGADHPNTSSILHDIAICSNHLGKKNEETAAREEEIALLRGRSGSDSPDLIPSLSALVDCYSELGRMQEAIQAREEVLALEQKWNGSLDGGTAATMFKLGRTYIRTGKLDKGLKIIRSLPARGIKRWLVLAPIQFEIGENNFALTNEFIREEARIEPRANERMKLNGVELIWRTIESQDSILDFNDLLGNQNDWSVAFAVCYVQSETDQSGLTMFISSDDQAKVYLNGKEIYRCEKNRGLWDARDRVDGLELHQGVNILLLKVVNGDGDWQANINFAKSNGQPVMGLRAALSPEETGEVFSETELPNPLSGNWTDVRNALIRNIELFPATQYDWLVLAPLLLQQGDIAAYDKHRHSMLKLFGRTNLFIYKERTAKACLLRPLEGEDLKIAARLADDAFREGNSSPLFMWFAFAKALAAYREGHFPQAAELAHRVIDDSADEIPRNAEAHFVLAMATHQLKKRDEARAVLAEGIEITEAKLPNLDQLTARNDFDWENTFTAHILMREAKALIDEDFMNSHLTSKK